MLRPAKGVHEEHGCEVATAVHVFAEHLLFQEPLEFCFPCF